MSINLLLAKLLKKFGNIPSQHIFIDYMSQNLSQYALFPTLTYAFHIQFLRFPYSVPTASVLFISVFCIYGMRIFSYYLSVIKYYQTQIKYYHAQIINYHTQIIQLHTYQNNTKYRKKQRESREKEMQNIYISIPLFMLYNR